MASRHRTAPPRPRRRRRHPHPGQDRHRRGRVRHRVRRHPQQLLPARHARADGALGRGLGVGPRGVRLSPRRLHADRAGGDARGRREDLRRAAGDRLPVRAHRGGARLPRLPARHVRRLAGPRHLRDPARGEGRLRQQRQVAEGPGREGSGRGRSDHAERPGHRRGHQRRRGHRGGHRPGPGAVRPARHRGRPVDPRPVGDAGPARPDPGHPARPPGRRARSDEADVDLLGPAGGDAGRGPQRVHRQPGRLPAGPARRFQRAALRRRHGRPHHRPDVGDLLQARLRLRRGPGRDLAVCRRPPGRRGGRGPVRPGQPRVHGDRGLRPDVDLRPGALPQAVRGQARPVPARAHRRDRRLHPGQLPGLRRVPAERLRDRRLQPRVQDDRRRRAGRQGTARRAAGAAGAVPVQPVPQRATCTRPATRPSPGANRAWLGRPTPAQPAQPARQSATTAASSCAAAPSAPPTASAVRPRGTSPCSCPARSAGRRTAARRRPARPRR